MALLVEVNEHYELLDNLYRVRLRFPQRRSFEHLLLSVREHLSKDQAEEFAEFLRGEARQGRLWVAVWPELGRYIVTLHFVIGGYRVVIHSAPNLAEAIEMQALVHDDIAESLDAALQAPARTPISRFDREPLV